MAVKLNANLTSCLIEGAPEHFKLTDLLFHPGASTYYALGRQDPRKGLGSLNILYIGPFDDLEQAGNVRVEVDSGWTKDVEFFIAERKGKLILPGDYYKKPFVVYQGHDLSELERIV